MMKKVFAALLACGTATSAQAAIIFGVDDTNTLVRFDSANPGVYTSSIAITGTTSSFQGLDFRSSNGLLYGLGSDRRLYTINTSTGFASAVSATQLDLGDGTLFGFDFNPVADALRIVTENNGNFRVNPNTGLLIARDTDVAYPGSTQDPDIVANAYLSGSTTQYAIDAAADTLVIQANNAGTLTTVGALGRNVGGRTSFDIVGSDNFVYSGSTLYRVDLGTGALTTVGNTSSVLYGIAIQQTAAVPEPATWAMMVAGFGALGATMRRRRRDPRVTYA